VFNLADYACSALNTLGYPNKLVNRLSDASGRTASNPEYEYGINALYALFAKVFTPEINQSTSANRENDFVATDIRDDFSKPPQIYSLNPDRCFNTTGRTQTCVSAEKNSFTVNGKNGTTTDYNGDGRADEDSNLDGEPDSIIGVGSKGISVNFFGFADTNRMPLRRVLVDWGDNSLIANDGKTGFYKNRKPFCGNELADGVKQCAISVEVLGMGLAGLSTGMTCKEDGDCPDNSFCSVEGSGKIFGNSSRACEQGYFEFGHSYSCSADDADTLVLELSLGQRDQLAQFGVGPNDKVCVFRPRVQLLDNWGWCNTNDGVGVFGDDINTKCNSINVEPWTYYKGVIIVIPSSPMREN
jgi:hypothetical protein